MDDDIKIQINSYDSYQASPVCLDNLFGQVSQVPVIRIHGPLVIHVKDEKYFFNTLVHIHNFFPYMYISCDYGFVSKTDTTKHLNELVMYIENLMGGPHKSGKRHYVASINICKGVPMYGYHVGYNLFYKISFLSPDYKTKFFNLIHNNLFDLKNISNSEKFKPLLFEYHLNYYTQFLVDFNLFSCNWLIFNNCHFRYPFPLIFYNSWLSILKNFLIKFTNDTNILNPKIFPKIGKNTLELDLKADQILNRNDIRPNDLHHNFHELLNTQEDTIYLNSLSGTINEVNYQSFVNDIDFKFKDKDKNNNSKRVYWSNNLHLRDLLNYSISLTTPIKNSDPVKYYNTLVAPINDQLTNFPTIFELLDIEIKYCQRQLQIGDFLVWNNLDDLFKLYDFEISSFSDQENDAINKNIEDSDQTDNNDEYDDKPNGVINDKFRENELFNWEAYHTNLGESKDLDSKKNSDISGPYEETIDNDVSTVSSQINDDQLMIQMTQNTKRQSQTISNSEPLFLSRLDILRDIEDNGLVHINYDDPFYDNKEDIPSRPLIYANRRIDIPNKTDIPPLLIDGTCISHAIRDNFEDTSKEAEFWTYTKQAPSRDEVLESYLHEYQRLSYKRIKFSSQIEPPITKSDEFKVSINNEKISRKPTDFAELTNFYLEVHVGTKINNRLPDPMKDDITMIIYKFNDANSMYNCDFKSGILLNNLEKFSGINNHISDKSFKIQILPNEFVMISKLIEIVTFFDPDILSGFEINSKSWGYLIERFKKKFSINLLPQLSRTAINSNGKFGDRWGYTQTSIINVTGRFTMNIWRILRKDFTLNNYNFEHCCYHILQRNFPKVLNFDLSLFCDSDNFRDKLFFLNYYISRILIEERFVDIQELVTKNVEHSRLIGIDFDSNFYRGSQFKVESILARLTKAENLLLNSPSKKEVKNMRSLEQIPLIMEPESNFYKSPLLVLDFQSLYPSIMVAFNYCYSTLLCKLHGFNPRKNNLGYLKHNELLPMMIDFFHKNDLLNISPNGYVFVKRKVRQSMLAKMLEELLYVRVNIKRFMNSFKKNEFPELYKVFNSRQLAIKLIANVTYGYTSATFSGRMPNSDIADAIVATGREILTKSIDMIEQSDYGAKVVYGDTDSLFVYLPGKSKEEAFDIGEKLSQYVTDQFPLPILLKFEKVYHPCVLLTKKRYVGNCFEHRDQKEPKFDAKGIETVRRDGIPATQKILEKSLRILFKTSNLSKVKLYVLNQFNKIVLNKVLVRDFCFTREVRYGTYKSEAHLPLGARIAQKNIENDPRSEPQYKERIAYIIYKDPTKLTLKDRCMSPEEFITSQSTDNPLELDYEYYITRVIIPPLERIFNLMGADIKGWYSELPKFKHQNKLKKVDISNHSYIHHNHCLGCQKKLDNINISICDDCLGDSHLLLYDSIMKTKVNQSKLKTTENTCSNCIKENCFNTQDGRRYYDKCQNHECVNYFKRLDSQKNTKIAVNESKELFDAVDNSESLKW